MSRLGGASLLQGLHDFWKHLNARTARVQLPAAMVGEHTAGKAGLVRPWRRLGNVALKAMTPSSAHCTPFKSTWLWTVEITSSRAFILVMLFNQGTS